MNIEVKFQPHQIAWFIRNDKVQSARVERVDVQFYMNSTKGPTTYEAIIVEFINDATTPLVVPTRIEAHKAFATKEELLASL